MQFLIPLMDSGLRRNTRTMRLAIGLYGLQAVCTTIIYCCKIPEIYEMVLEIRHPISIYWLDYISLAGPCGFHVLVLFFFN